MDGFSNVFLVCSETFLRPDSKSSDLQQLRAAHLKLRCFCGGCAGGVFYRSSCECELILLCSPAPREPTLLKKLQRV